MNLETVSETLTILRYLMKHFAAVSWNQDTATTPLLESIFVFTRGMLTVAYEDHHEC